MLQDDLEAMSKRISNLEQRMRIIEAKPKVRKQKIKELTGALESMLSDTALRCNESLSPAEAADAYIERDQQPISCALVDTDGKEVRESVIFTQRDDYQEIKAARRAKARPFMEQHRYPAEESSSQILVDRVFTARPFNDYEDNNGNLIYTDGRQAYICQKGIPSKVNSLRKVNGKYPTQWIPIERTKPKKGSHKVKRVLVAVKD